MIRVAESTQAEEVRQFACLKLGHFFEEPAIAASAAALTLAGGRITDAIAYKHKKE